MIFLVESFIAFSNGRDMGAKACQHFIDISCLSNLQHSVHVWAADRFCKMLPTAGILAEKRRSGILGLIDNDHSNWKASLKGETGARIHKVMSDLVWLETLTWTEETGEKKDVLPAVADPDQISVWLLYCPQKVPLKLLRKIMYEIYRKKGDRSSPLNGKQYV